MNNYSEHNLIPDENFRLGTVLLQYLLYGTDCTEYQSTYGWQTLGAEKGQMIWREPMAPNLEVQSGNEDEYSTLR